METRNKMSNNNSNERKRKSRFDIAPPSSSLISSWTNIDVSANTANLSVPNFSIEGPQSIPLSLSVSVVDVAFRERLDRAMEKNLAYIERSFSLSLCCLGMVSNVLGVPFVVLVFCLSSERIH